MHWMRFEAHQHVILQIKMKRTSSRDLLIAMLPMPRALRVMKTALRVVQTALRPCISIAQ